MRTLIIVAAAAGVAMAVGGYGTPAADRDDYDEVSYTKAAIVNMNSMNNNNNAVNTVSSYQPTTYDSADNSKTTYPSSYGSDRVKSTRTNGYQPPMQTYSRPAPQTYAPAAPQTYAPAAPQTYAPAAPQTYAPAAPQTYAPAAPQTYAPAAPQTYAPAAPQTYSNGNGARASSYARSQPSTFASNGRSSARLSAAYGPNNVYEVTPNLIEPYSFAYTAEDGEGSHSHMASSDAQGRVSGEYTIQLADGRNRVVKYTADERGYRADIVTNELGTESKNPADVTIQSSALTGEQAAIQYTQEYQRQILQQQQQAANYAQQQAANYAQQRVASYNNRASARQTQPAYAPAAPYTAPAAATTPRVAAPAYVPVSPVSGRLSASSVTTEASLQGDHNAGYNDATAVVDVTPLRPAVEQVPQRTTSDGSSKRRNKQTYG